MKVRWRQHGIILVSMLAVVAVIHDLWIAVHLTQQQIQRYAFSFLQNHRPFNYYYNFLIPQIGSVIFLYACYLWISLLIIPKIHISKFPKTGLQTVKQIAWVIVQLIIICFLIGPGVNFASFYANPYTFYYGLNYFPFTFGYHPQPFANAFGGLDAAIFWVIIYMICISIREVIIYYIEKSAYLVTIANQVTIALMVYFIIAIFQCYWPIFTNESIYRYYLSFSILALAVFMINIYWLFPYRRWKSIYQYSLVGRLLLSTFICTLLCSVLLRSEWSVVSLLVFWALQLFLISPVSWVVYQQQKDHILNLRNVQTALVKSKADLQFLRSQINPHFLFNALNTLYGTALMDGSKNTAAGIQKLGDMMRFMLHENNQDFIAMSKEVEYLKNYIALQKLRMQVSPDILIEDSINITSNDNQIAPMLLIPFVENAFKHGVSLTDPSWIKIKLDGDDNNIRFEVRNSLHPYVNSDPEKEHSGIGLQNVKERLLLLYPGKHEFIYGEEGNEYIVKLSIQL